MKIGAVLNAVGEEELIGRCIAHLRMIGVDHIMISHLDDDLPLRRAIEPYRGDADIHIFNLGPMAGVVSNDIMTPLMREMIAKFEVDRVMFLDPDEFWLPKSGDIKKTRLLAQTDVLSVRRLNVPLVVGDPILPDELVPENYDKIRLISRPVKISPDTSMNGIQVPWIMTPIIPKIMVKPSVVDTIAIGGHGVSKEAQEASTAEPDDLVIAHLPFSTLARFQTKLENIDKTMVNAADLFVGLEGWHWRRWNAIWRAGKAEQEFNWQWMSPEQLQQAMATGQVQTVDALFATLAEQSRKQRGGIIRRLIQSLKNQFQM